MDGNTVPLHRFVCACCHVAFETPGSQEEAAAEALALFGSADAANDPNMSEVCDDCFGKLMRHHGHKGF